MANRFEEILDDCLDRLTLKGETVESCLARYPEYAAQLEPYLRTATRVAKAYAFVLTRKEVARQRLLSEKQILRQDKQPIRHDKAAWWWNLGWPHRRATLAAAVFLLVLLSSVSSVAFASNALPSDTLYPIKRGTERLLVALPLPHAEKAKLSLTYAERRAEEIVALAKEGKAPELPQLQNDLHQQLDTAIRATTKVKNEQELVELKSQFQASASQTLTKLQSALEEAPQDSRQTVTDTFQASSQAFGTAIETITSRVPGPVVTAAAPGILQLLATDPPPPSVDQVLVTVSQIEVFLSAGDKSQWIVITQQPQTFDLLRVAEIQKFLGQKQVEPGTYTKVRLLVTGTTVVAGGQQYSAKVPSGSLSLVRPFVVEQGKITSVLLDFDGARSLQTTGQNEFIMRPVVNVLVQQHVEQEKQKGKESQKPERGGGKRGTEHATEKLSRAQFEGTLEAIAPDHLVVQGVRIDIAPSTKVEGKLEAGRKVEVEAIFRPDGTFLAVKVEGDKEQSQPSKSEGKGPNGKTEDKETASKAPVRLSGLIQKSSPTELTVDSRTIAIAPDTKVEGVPSVGLAVEVEGRQQPDGKVLATSIKVLGRAEERGKDEGKQTGSQEKAKPSEKPGEEKEGHGKAQVSFTGTIEKVTATELTVNGKVVAIGPETRLQGTPAIGLRAQVEGQQQPDGKLLASSIQVMGKPEEKEKQSTETAKPPENKGETGRR